MVRTIDKITKAIDRITLESGRRPDEVHVHPDKAPELRGATEIAGVKVCVPSWKDLEILAVFLGKPPYSDAFWDKEKVYFVTKKTEDTALSVQPADARPSLGSPSTFSFALRRTSLISLYFPC